MIIVDTSVWINYFNNTSNPQTDSLELLLGNRLLGTGDIILTEVLQGIRSDDEFDHVNSRLLSLVVVEMLNTQRAIRCAQRYRTLRKRGITIRRTIDLVIASYCIDEGHSLLFSDRDFLPFVKYLGLKAV